MNNTEELIAVAWEFGMADYIGPVYFKLLQEIVDLRNVLAVKDDLLLRLYNEKFANEN